jgi:hypothetical protein
MIGYRNILHGAQENRPQPISNKLSPQSSISNESSYDQNTYDQEPDEVKGLVLDDDMEYFETGFDPSNWKPQKLRSLLVQYEFEYPSSANKTQLAEIFRQNILPLRDIMLAAHSKVHRSTKGIIDAQPSHITREEET